MSSHRYTVPSTGTDPVSSIAMALYPSWCFYISSLWPECRMIYNRASGGVRALVKHGQSVDQVWDNWKHTLVAQALILGRCSSIERLATTVPVCYYHHDATTYYRSAPVTSTVLILYWSLPSRESILATMSCGSILASPHFLGGSGYYLHSGSQPRLVLVWCTPS